MSEHHKPLAGQRYVKMQPIGVCPACDAAWTRPKHNHPTRDIKDPGVCPGCDAYHKRQP